jgi:hypothetical protein
VLQSEAVKRMDVGVQADAIRIHGALRTAFLLVTDSAGSFAKMQFDDAKFGSVFSKTADA